VRPDRVAPHLDLDPLLLRVRAYAVDRRMCDHAPAIAGQREAG
jgi:hypothetical protein